MKAKNKYPTLFIDVPDGDFCYLKTKTKPPKWLACRFLLNTKGEYVIPAPYTDKCTKYQTYIDAFYRKCKECKK